MRGDCKRVNCHKQTQLDGLCATHFRNKHGITTGEAKRRRKAGESVEGDRHYEQVAVAPDGRRYGTQVVSSGRILRDFNVDNETAASLLNLKINSVVEKRVEIAEKMCQATIGSDKYIINKISEALAGKK